MKTAIQDTRTKIGALLSDYHKKKYATAHKIAPDYGRLWEAMIKVSAAGGKRLRAHMILLAYEAYGGKDNILPVAAAWELLHGCLLMHDDIIDRDYMRHGQPNIAGYYLETYKASKDREHFANGAALLAGDAALTSAYDIVLQSDLTPDQKIITAQAISDCVFIEVGGELVDSESVLLPIGKSDTELIAYLKTAKYSFIDPLSLGAKLAGASKEELQKIEHLGRVVGIGFQLADDLLGMFGDPKKTGKSTTSDLREGKRTMLLHEIVKRASTDELASLHAIVGRRDVTELEAKTVCELAVSNGAKQVVETRIENYSKDAEQAIASLEIPTEYKQALQELVDMALKRSH